MNKILMIITLISVTLLFAQRKDDGIRDNYLGKEMDITERAGNAHNASNIGLFFENRGKLYPRRLSQGPSLEFPINSGKHYGYRVNPYVGIPGNVIQGRFTTNEEWEAVGGYHNRDLAKIAMSDNPNTWPKTGWPLKDNSGKPIIKSDQDSYCIYSDSNNSRGVQGIYVAQTGYAYGVSFAKNLLFFKYDVINKGKKNLDSLYFSLYYDIDVGNISGGDPEYADDKLDFDKAKNFVYVFDDGLSSEWPGGKTGFMGVVFLKTPKVNGKELGITDMHYNLYDDDIDIDSIQYGIMSSNAGLYNSNLGKKYFHLGGNTNLHFDDPNTIPAGGTDLVSNISSGPYKLNIGDTLSFYTAFVAGETKTELYYFLDQAYKIMNFDFEISKPPTTPTLSASAGDKKIVLYWDDKAEYSKDNFSGENDFEGYRLYRSLDKGVNWTLLADYDVPGDKIGSDKGLQYSYVDSTIINGIEYWYSITAYDRGDSSIASLESPKGNTSDLPNVKAVTAFSNALGRTPVGIESVQHPGGSSNYIFDVKPVDKDSLNGNEYKVGFTFTARQEKGKPFVKGKVQFVDSSNAVMGKWGIEWVDSKNFFIIDYSTGDPTSQGQIAYQNGKVYPVKDPVSGKTYFNVQLNGPNHLTAPPDSLPVKGDIIGLAFSNYALRNNKDTVISPRPVLLDKPQSTSDGIIFEIKASTPINDLSRTGGSDYFDLSFTTSSTGTLKNETYLISVTNKGFKDASNGFISLLIRGIKGDTVKKFDTLFNLGSFDFNGVNGVVRFTGNNPPSVGNSYALKTIIPAKPSVKDLYNFKIAGSKINREIIKSNLSNIKVVPNPYVVSSLYEQEYGELRKEPLRQIQFINLPNEAKIHIFTIDGDLIKTLYHNSLTGTMQWDLKAEGGREISAGIYIYVVKSGDSETINRFAVIK